MESERNLQAVPAKDQNDKEYQGIFPFYKGPEQDAKYE